MSSEEASCSDCKLEIIQIRWTQLLVNWINKCVRTKKKSDQIDMNTLYKIIKKYKEEISNDETDKALLSTNEVELFIKYKFPIARLENLSEEKEMPKKLYIMASILLFYCCVNSQSGRVDADICAKLDQKEQEMILKFCEVLSECEVTVNNIDNAIKEACEVLEPIKKIAKADPKVKTKKHKVSTDGESAESVASTKNPQIADEKKKVTIQPNIDKKEQPVIKFKSSITVLPSVVTDTSSYSKSSAEHFSDVSELSENTKRAEEDEVIASNSKETTVERAEVVKDYFVKGSEVEEDSERRCQPECACTRCSSSGPCCGDPGSSMDQCKECKEKPKKHVRLKDFSDMPQKRPRYMNNWKLYLVLVIGTLLAILLIITIYMMPPKKEDEVIKRKRSDETVAFYPDWAWECKKNLCQKVFRPASNSSIHNSLSRCTLLCMGPQLWPYPIGYTHFSKTIIGLTTDKLEYKFQAIPSDIVRQYLAEAFKLFIKDLIRLEKIHSKPKNRTDLMVRKMSIEIEVDNDADPRIRVNTDETYTLKMDTKDKRLLIRLSSASFCGVRHGLETLSQLILLDQTSGYLITVSSVTIKDGPSYKYRGLMIDTGRNFIPISDLMRTVDGMASCKLNTFHWRISDVASFPLHIPEIPELFEYGPYDRSMVYTKDDVKALVERAGFRGIRVLIEVAIPGPVGRPWSWSKDTSCPRQTDNDTCDNVLCLRFKMKDSLFDALQVIYSEILDLTKVDDVFHLSDGVFSMSNCFFLMEDREGFLDKALERLKLANGGFLPRLPIIWYTSHLARDFEAKTWERYGVQLNDWNPALSNPFLSKFRVIHSAKWDLSCEMKKKRCVKYR
ncbi:uncharacterized protein [Epargyreus clarus]|uniref:uncharacterized protein isoform X1 n=1 Tax=Epargyreus clarus TaxID=520877 RepID=UPI003C303BB8